MKMPYGKFKGRDIENIPSWYLKWIAENWKEDMPENKLICKEADQEWQWRERNDEHID